MDKLFEYIYILICFIILFYYIGIVFVYNTRPNEKIVIIINILLIITIFSFLFIE